MTVRYRIDDAPEAPGGRSITCLMCGRTSLNPSDVSQLYCGFCHNFLRDPGDQDSIYSDREQVKAALDRAADELL